MKITLEKLAELEHEQWIYWSKAMYDFWYNESDRVNRLENKMEKWKKLWRPYSKLTKVEKDQDRIWARKVLKIIQDIP